MSTRAVILNEIVKTCSAKKIDGYMIDLTTAGAMLTIYNALKPESQAKFDAIPLPKLVDFCWKNVS